MKPGQTSEQLRKELAGYAQAGKSVPRSHGASAELGPLSDEDEQVLDRVWDELAQQEAPDEGDARKRRAR